MGTEIRCKECGQVLFEFNGVPSDVLWYSRFRYQVDGECPSCGHKLPDVSKYTREMQLEVKSVFPILAK